MLAHNLLDGFARFVGMVEWDGADIVVQNVSLNDTVKELTANETEFAVDGGSSTTSEVPNLRLVVRESRVGVLKVGNGNCSYTLTRNRYGVDGREELTKPVVHPEIRDSVPHEEVEPAKVLSEKVQDAAHDEKAHIARDDELSIFRLVQRTRRVEMVDTSEEPVPLALPTTLWLFLVIVMAGDIGEEIHWPSKQLLENEVGSGEERGFLHQFRQFMDGFANSGCILFPGFGNEHHVTGEVSGRLVVLCMRDLPREVRDQQKRMQDKPDSVVEDL